MHGAFGLYLQIITSHTQEVDETVGNHYEPSATSITMKVCPRAMIRENKFRDRMDGKRGGKSSLKRAM